VKNTREEIVIGGLSEEQYHSITTMSKNKGMAVSRLLSEALEQYAEVNNIPEGTVVQGNRYLRVRVSPTAKTAYTVLVDKMLTELLEVVKKKE
jgi:hypothetical protein